MNLKALGLALIAVFALSAMTASAASAQQGMITSPSGPFWLEGVDEIPTEPKLHAFGGATACHDADYTGGKVAQTTGTGHHVELPSGASSFTLTPTYDECVSGTGLPETITMNGCDYVIDIGNTVGESKDLYSVTADLVCPVVEGVEQEITIDIYGNAAAHEANSVLCTIHVPGGEENDNLAGGTLTDEPTSDHLTLGGTIEGVTMTITGPSACAPGNVTTKVATLELEATIEGKDSATEGKAVELNLSH